MAATIDDQISRLMVPFDEVEQAYIRKVAEQVRTIGELNASSINRLVIMATLISDTAEISQRLQQALRITYDELIDLYEQAADEISHDPRFDTFLGPALTEPDKEMFAQLARSVSNQTYGLMSNLSNTTVADERFRRVVDQAILAATSGTGSYTEAMRDAIKKLGSEGLQVQYESGYHRNLQTAVRSLIVSGTAQIEQEAADILAEREGCDAKEISVHACPAPDHAPVQGHVFLNEEFERMQSGQDFVDLDGQHFEGFRRPIGEWNCMHMAMGFHTAYSKPMYTKEALQQILDKNEEGFEWNGKHYTTYQGNQMMRRIETAIRKQKSIANAARVSGDEELQAVSQRTIDGLGGRYMSLSKASGLRPKPDRMNVSSFRRYKPSTK